MTISVLLITTTKIKKEINNCKNNYEIFLTAHFTPEVLVCYL